jgi:hypothetical protein
VAQHTARPSIRIQPKLQLGMQACARARAAAAVAAHTIQQTIRFAHRLGQHRTDGRRRRVDLLLQLSLVDRLGLSPRVCVTGQNITERKRMESHAKASRSSS